MCGNSYYHIVTDSFANTGGLHIVLAYVNSLGVTFDGNIYICRIVKSNEGEELLIGSTALLDALHPGSFEDENEGFASKEAEQIYDEVFFFTDAKTLKLPDDELITELKEDNPEWFN